MAPKKDSGSSSFAIGDFVLGRIKGYPPWPAKIVDPQTEFLRKDVLAAKKGKKGNPFLVRYYPDATYSWSPGNELKPLPRKDIDQYVAENDKGGKAALLVAYKTAQDPEQWEKTHQENQDKARNAKDDDLEGDDDDDEPEDKPTGSKRKAGKGKATTSKKQKAEPKKDAKKDKKADKKKDDLILDEGGKKCKEWRHKLQRAFLGDTAPKAEQMLDFDKIFTEMEGFTFQGEWLTATKLPKVLRRIHNLENIPEQDKYEIKKRAGDLVEKWKALVPEGKEGDDGNASPTAATAQKDEGAHEGDLTVADQSMAIDPPEDTPVSAAAEPETPVTATEPATNPEDAPKVNGDAPVVETEPLTNGDATHQAPAEAEPPKAEDVPATES